MTKMTGYFHAAYVQALHDAGMLRELLRSNGRIFVCRIPGFPYHDAMDPYPLFTCRHWAQLSVDLGGIGNETAETVKTSDSNYFPAYRGEFA